MSCMKLYSERTTVVAWLDHNCSVVIILFIPTSTVRSPFFTERIVNVWNIVFQATLLIFLHSPHLGLHLNVLILVTFLISRSCSLHTGVIFRPMLTALFVSFSCVIVSYSYFVFVLFCIMSPFGQLLFQPCRACYILILYCIICSGVDPSVFWVFEHPHNFGRWCSPVSDHPQIFPENMRFLPANGVHLQSIYLLTWRLKQCLLLFTV